MKRRVLFAFAFCATLLVGFGLGHFRVPATATARQPLYYVHPVCPTCMPDERSSGSRTARVLGRVTADEIRIFRVNVGTDGYIKATQDSMPPLD